MIGTILFIIFSSISILISCVLAVLFWKRRSFIGSLSMCLLLVAAIEWSFFTTLSVLIENSAMKILFDNLTFIGVVSVPVAWFVFSICYTRQDRLFELKHYILLLIIPFITLILLFVDSSLFIEKRAIGHLSNTTLHLIEYNFGIWFWVHTVYSYTLMFMGMLILIQRLIKNFMVYRNQTIIMISAILIPFVGAWKYLIGIGPYANLDLTTFFFSISGVLLFVGMFKFRLLDLVPIAREAVIEIMSDLVIVLDSHNRIIDMNNSARYVFSKDNSNLIGQPITQIMNNADSLLGDIYDGYQPSNEIILEVDGQKRYYNTKLLPLVNKKGLNIGSFIVLSNITDLKQTMEDLNISKLAAENANKAKSEFLATMSHEIRTPINGIIGMSELLESADLNTQEKENLSALQYSANSLLYIINEILDFSKIEAGKMQIESHSFNIRKLAINTANTFAYKNTKGILLTQVIDDSIPEYLTGDSAKLGQILTNLISNAFKFTEKGEVNVQIQCIQKSSSNVLLSFTIADTGIGIPQDKLPNLFQSFHQLDSSTTRKYGGTGLGLSIVKNLVELMQGTIEVKSEVGKGSSFIFQLPFRLEEADPCSNMEKVLVMQSKALKILIAEDSRINQALMKQLIEKKGWQADIADNGKQVLDKLYKMNYDLILMDVQMPEMDGYEATKRIRQSANADINKIPIIALTANATFEDKELCLQCGMNNYLAKPIKSDKLYECIMKHVVELK